MDTNSSGEEQVIKTRKPYTITKQRERWTEEEHNRFLEALKLYGRAWQRIEEHIGTKTAVQIRSHAQKFFSKLEKEAHAKGIPVCQTLDIEIPPPRPKKKPSNPYPRKMGNGSANSQMVAKDAKLTTPFSSQRCKRALDLELVSLPEKHCGEGLSKQNEKQNEGCSEVLCLLPEAPSCSVSSVNKSFTPMTTAVPKSHCILRDFTPPQEVNQDDKTKKATNTDNPSILQSKSLRDVETGGENGMPFHIPSGISSPQTTAPHSVSFQGSVFHPIGEAERLSDSSRNAASATVQNYTEALRASHQAFQTFHRAFTPVSNVQDDSQSFSNNSSTFSNLIIATLLQNPAVHAAASFAASCWSFANVDRPADTQMSNNRSCPSSHMSMAALAAATVAAATAWWAAHGLLPFCTPFSSCFTSGPSGMCGAPSAETDYTPATKVEEKETGNLNADQHSGSKSTSSSISESDEGGSNKLKDEPKIANNEDAETLTKLSDSNKATNRKPVDPSSCGSNTPSSSDIPTDAQEKQDNGRDEKDAETNHQATEPTNRRFRCTNSGRMAFQALFSREVLPQSFSPPYEMKSKGNQKTDCHKQKQSIENKHSHVTELDLNCQTTERCEVEKKKAATENYDKEELLTIGLGQVKLKARKNGFKPYKRCSVEAKENRVSAATSQTEEKGPKRIRVEGQASI